MGDLKEKCKKFRKLAKLSEQINAIYNGPKDWEKKFDLIFELYKPYWEEFPISYYNPDTSYQEDVSAFVWAFREKYSEKVDKILEELQEI